MSEMRHFSHYEAGETALAGYLKFQVKTLLSVEVKYLEGIKGIEKKFRGLRNET